MLAYVDQANAIPTKTALRMMLGRNNDSNDAITSGKMQYPSTQTD